LGSRAMKMGSEQGYRMRNFIVVAIIDSTDQLLYIYDTYMI